MLVKLKGVHKVKRKLADGTTAVYYYAWRGGPRMMEKPHTEAFAAELARHKTASAPKVVETLASLIDRFTGPEEKRTPDFLALAETTQTDHLYAFRLIKEKWPHLPAKLTQQPGMKKEIRKWHRSFAANPRKADKLLFSLSKVFSYAIADELLDKNPCTGIDRLYQGSRKESLWTPAQIAMVRAKVAAHLLLPFEIALATGQRQGDILAMTWKQWDGTYLMFRQSKTGKRLKVKANARIKAMLDPMKKDTLRVCLNSRSRPWTKDGFKTSWGKAMASEEVKIEDVVFHDLRGTFICDRAREGSSIEDIARISGHSMSEVKSVLEKHYLATDQHLADAVILRMERNP